MTGFTGSDMSCGASAKKAEAGTCCAYNLIALILGAAIAASILILLCLETALALLLVPAAVLLVSRVAVKFRLRSDLPKRFCRSFE